MYCDGNGLYLRVVGPNSKAWVLRTTVHGNRVDIGLGSLKFKGLADAREEARALRRIARTGGDPRVESKPKGPTFREAAERALDAQKNGWSSEKHARVVWSSLDRYVLPEFGDRRLDQISTHDIFNLVEPIWMEKQDTARRIRQRIARVFDWAKGAGVYFGENPVNGVAQALPAHRRNVRHHPAMDWRDLPGFMKELHSREAVSARLTELTILTCLRSKEARSLEWGFVRGDTLFAPGEIMKGGKAHKVPLPLQSLAVIGRIPRDDRTLLFPAPPKPDDPQRKPISGSVYDRLYKRMQKSGFTTHGFRSTFRDWCTDNDVADVVVAEAALAHEFGTAVERAYARSDLFERRRDLMREWADFAFESIRPD